MVKEYYLPSGRMCPRDIRSEARELMAKDGNRLTLCVAEIAVILMAMAAFILISLADTILFYFGVTVPEYAVDISIAAVEIILIIPLALGVNKITFLQIQGETAHTADIFSAYRILPRTWLVQIIMSIPAAVCLGGVWLACHMSRIMMSLAIIERGTFMRPVMISAAAAVGAIIILGGIALYLRMYFFSAYAMRGDMGVFKALGASFCATRGRKRRIIGFLFGFIWWGLLGLLTLGVIHIYHTAPYYNTAYMIFADSSEDRNV